MLNDAGIRTRMSLAAVMLGVAASVTVIAAIGVAAWPTTKTWFAADASVGATIWTVRLSRAAVPPPAPATTSCSESATEAAAKLVYWSPDTTIWSLAAKLTVLDTLPAAPPVSVAVVSAVFHVMLTVAGMRMRRSFAAVIVGMDASVTLIALIAVGAWATRNT